MIDLKELSLRRGVLTYSQAFVKTLAPKEMQLAAAVELANLGFIVEPQHLENFDARELISAIEAAKRIVGEDRDMVPVYPNFPKGVQELSTLTLLVEQIIHYLSAGILLPDHPAELRPGLPITEALKNARQVEVLLDIEWALEMATKLVNSPVAMSKEDSELLEALVKVLGDYPVELSAWESITGEAKNRENVQHFAKALLNNEICTPLDLFMDYGVGHLDQVLRVFLVAYGEAVNDNPKSSKAFERAVYNLSDGYAWAVRFKPMPRIVRREIVERLGQLSGGFKGDLLVKHRVLWRRVIKTIHGFEFAKTGGEKRALDIISSNVDHKTFNSLVEASLEAKEPAEAIKLLAEHQPGNLLRRLVAIGRMVSSVEDEVLLGQMVANMEGVRLSTLVSAYNGVLNANDSSARVVRVAGANNSMVEREVEPVGECLQKLLLSALKNAIVKGLGEIERFSGTVGIVGEAPVPLVKRDASSADRSMDRGARFDLGEFKFLRLFGHWRNNQDISGYMDIGAVVLDGEAEVLGVSDWASWSGSREWSTYSGDKLVFPGEEAAEYVDVDVEKLMKVYPTARYVALTVQSWSGFAIARVDFIGGVMGRTEEQAGEVFEARTVATAFKPSTNSLQSVPLVVDLESGEMVWIDSSSGSTVPGVNSARDVSIGKIVYDEICRERLTLGDLATLYAKAQNLDVAEESQVSEELKELLFSVL